MNKVNVTVKQPKEVPENGQKDIKESLEHIHHRFIMNWAKLSFLQMIMRSTDELTFDGDELCGLAETLRDIQDDIKAQADTLENAIYEIP
jgi:hypothetical protein